ncbi:arylsulfatase [Mycolicibacterium conceptionense]|uniref:arylsulfatase n=1 Tax=Mycolicibacterium conceptionense TaxID=451644 RepID=UPI0007ECA8B3|nr:arylsulfatase [Mycolicibacterium conceptionense]OBK04848.1 arylsulfatase [Mycolicibacterium conceptionense]OMB80131.1 arylsulfatase [Mycolicibacterium conceptionense]OMB90607.1 arylsulfatase [Mycolicibacterium conceptionense]
MESKNDDMTQPDGDKRGKFSRRSMLGGIAATGVGVAAAGALVAGCEDNTGKPGAGGNAGPPDYGTGINEGFDGTIELDVRDSKPDWKPFELKHAPEGAPNVLVVLFDDTGMASWSPYGGRINMPTLQRLADNGLTYSQWHTTALCSPTRSCMLTGRNHHVNRFASITEGSDGFPGAAARLPAQCATVGQVLQDNGYSTFWVGKDHNVPEEDVSSGGSKSEWPLQKGFDRFYGFLGGETNQWYPDLTEDNRFIDQPYAPEQGYHLSKDLADQAIRMLRDQRSSNPSKPWYMWFCPGANHAPHHSPEEYSAKYKGQFDDGYEAYREWVLKRMIDKGIMPEGTQLTPINPLPEDVASEADAVRPWDSLNPDEKKLFSRMAEVFAGFSEYTDAQVGRVVDYLEQTGQLDNTVIFYCADNGASGEGSPNGSVNENKFFNGYPDDLAENMKMLDKLGTPDTYNHYPTGWAVAFSTPFQMFKRYSQFSGGTCDPMVIHWPKGIKARGEVRHQYHHATDVVPTILDVAGIEMPEEYRGIKQYPINGVSMRYSFDGADAPTTKKRQYYAMLGTRGIWQDGWKASALHAPISGKGHFDQDKWELFHVDEDRSEAKNVADQNPEKLKELIDAWNEEAKNNYVLPLDDRTAVDLITIQRPQFEPPRTRYLYYPDTAPVPEGVAVNIRGRSYKIIADVDMTKAAQGVLFAHGSRFGGHALFIKDNKLHYVYNFLGIKPEQVFASGPLPEGKHALGMEFIWEKKGEYGESLGTTILYVDGKEAAKGPMRAQTGKFTLAGDGLCVGFDSGDNVSDLYQNPGRFTGGTIKGVAVDVSEEKYVDLNREAQAAFATD